MGITVRQKLEKAISVALGDSQKAIALYQLAAHLDSDGKESEAWVYYEKAIKLGLDDTTNAQALTYLGSTFYNLREWRKARMTFEEARTALQALPRLPSCTVKGKPVLSFVRERLEELRSKKDREKK